MTDAPGRTTDDDGTLRFGCGACGHALEAPAAFAGVVAPCPVCGFGVRAPFSKPVEAWVPAAPALVPPPLPLPVSNPVPAALPVPVPPLPPVPRSLPGSVAGPISKPVSIPGPVPIRRRSARTFPLARTLPVPRKVPAGHTAPLREAARSREAWETEAAAGHQQRVRKLRFFDAALICLTLGMLALGGAALAFTQARPAGFPAGSPELSHLVVERMQRVDGHRDEAVREARNTLAALFKAADSRAAEQFLMPGGPAAEGLTFPIFPAAAASAGKEEGAEFEFIQARRIPGTERFLTLFERVSDLPLVLPVEETAAGTRVHGQALAQQMDGRLGKFLAGQGPGEAVFYVLLRPAPEPMAAEFVQSRPDLRGYMIIAVEPAFPADGGHGCLACVAPGSAAAGIFAKRAHDPGLRQAVVNLAWRQTPEMGKQVELTAFQMNVWSRH